MIVTKKKPEKEILESLEGYERIYVMGCGECATINKTGGKDEVAAMQKFLEENRKTIVGASVSEIPCNEPITRREFRGKAPDADCILVLACGGGISALDDLFNIPVVPALNTHFLGTTTSRTFEERCSLCGECVLADTGGICPVTRCPKEMLNGPCSGVKDGKCEVDYDKDCVWILIYNRLKERNQLGKMRKYQAPKNHELEMKPRSAKR